MPAVCHIRVCIKTADIPCKAGNVTLCSLSGIIHTLGFCNVIGRLSFNPVNRRVTNFQLDRRQTTDGQIEPIT